MTLKNMYAVSSSNRDAVNIYWVKLEENGNHIFQILGVSYNKNKNQTTIARKIFKPDEKDNNPVVAFLIDGAKNVQLYNAFTGFGKKAQTLAEVSSDNKQEIVIPSLNVPYCTIEGENRITIPSHAIILGSDASISNDLLIMSEPEGKLCWDLKFIGEKKKDDSDKNNIKETGYNEVIIGTGGINNLQKKSLTDLVAQLWEVSKRNDSENMATFSAMYEQARYNVKTKRS